MNIVNRLSLRHLRINKGRTIITLVGIALSVAMICSVAGFVISLRDLLWRETVAEGNYHVAYSGVSAQTAAALAQEEIFSSSYTKESATEGLLNIFLRLKHPGRDIEEVAGAMMQQYEMTEMRLNTELLALEGVVLQSTVLTTMVTVAAIAILVIIAGSVAVIGNAFQISSSERTRQFGLLKSAGATGAQLFGSVLFETLFLVVIAFPVGVALGFIVQTSILGLTNGLLSELSVINGGNLSFRVIISPAVIAFTFITAVVTTLLSAARPAMYAARINPIDAVYRKKSINISGKRLKTSPLTQRLFGFEGTLAAKSLKRSRSRYRATVISLSVSIVMMISMSSFVWALNKSVEMVYGGYDLDAQIRATGSVDQIDAARAAVLSVAGADIKATRFITLGTATPDGFVADNAPEGAGESGVLLHLLPDDKFAEYILPDGGNLTGVLINTITYSRDDKKLEITPYAPKPETALPLYFRSAGGETPSEAGTVIIGAETRELPAHFSPALFDGFFINIIIPESAYRAFFNALSAANPAASETMKFAVTTANPDAFCETAETLLGGLSDSAERPNKKSDQEEFNYYITNISQQTRMERNITTIIMLFGYGFIAMLSLIAATSVISTISAGMALRRQEFAMLYSVGITPRGLGKMLNLESLLYGLKSILIGVPVGTILSYIIYQGMGNAFVFAYRAPVSAILLSAAAVMLLVFATMRYGRNKLRGINIIDALKKDTA